MHDWQVGETKRHELAEIIKKTGYDNPEVARRYYELYSREGIEPKISRHFSRILDETLPKEGLVIDSETKSLKDCTVLDLGSGPGVLSELLQERFGKVIAVDKAPAIVDFINQQPLFKDKTEARVGDFGGQFPIEDQGVEVVVSFNTTNELRPEDEDNFLQEIARVVKSGGFALLNRIADANNLAMKHKFSRERQRELADSSPDALRNHVFLSSELESQINSLVSDKGIEAKVEIFDDHSDQCYCIAKINFNRTKTDET